MRKTQKDFGDSRWATLLSPPKQGHLLDKILCTIIITQVNTILLFQICISVASIYPTISESVIDHKILIECHQTYRIRLVNCTIYKSVLMEVPIEQDQTYRTELVLIRN